MLYLTTRDTSDTYTPYETLYSDAAPDGGAFVPLSLPAYDDNALRALRGKKFGQIVAEVLNQFFTVQISGWDVDFSIGRNSVKLVPMNIKIVIAELWHNPQSNFSHTVHALYKSLCNNEQTRDIPTQWVKIAAYIAVLFALFGEMLTQDITTLAEPFDISVPLGDFTGVTAAVYAQKMGLPIGTIICTCDDNSSVWDLIHRGIFTPTAADAQLLPGLERLFHFKLGTEEAKHFCEMCGNGRVYSIGEEQFSNFNAGLFCAVTGKNRADSMINSVLRSNSYIIDPITALCYGGLQDYRARTGENKLTLLLSETTPLNFVSQITSATGISSDQLVALVNKAKAGE